MPRNILFIMCDQLRADYLSCYGHTRLHTPNIDSLAELGVRFSHAYCQAPLCGPSRTSFYTGRYQSSHGVMANEDDTRIDELMLADYLRPYGYRSALVGKTHNHKNLQAMMALGIDSASQTAQCALSAGFEPFDRHEGLYPDGAPIDKHAYSQFLLSRGYQSKNPWHEFANSGEDEDGNIRSGWHMRNSRYPARVAEEHSETSYTTGRAIDFLEQQEDDKPWCLHLSYIKPHWPWIAPSPYHNKYQKQDIQPVVRSGEERDQAHPVVQAFMQQQYSESFARDDVREQVIPVYMGLVRQIDDQLGRLFEYMKQRQLFENTMIVFTSDHGDYLGDHWLGEKDLFHEPSARIPLIVFNPDISAAETRGRLCNEMVEAIDLVPTFVEFAGGGINHERLEGRSLMPLLLSHSAPQDWRRYAVSETDYSHRGTRSLLDIPAYDCRATMIRENRWKYIHYNLFQPQLFDMQNDPGELNDLGEDPAFENVRHNMQTLLIDWRRRLKPRIGMPYGKVDALGPERDEAAGIIIGRW